MTTALSYTIGGLQCGRAYTISVDAFDAADNRSGLATVTTSTSPCPIPVGTVLPGQSWDAACNAASPGDVIFVAPGSHPSQTFTCNKAAPGVVFRATPGAANDSVRVGYIDTATTNDADGISIEGDAFYLGGFHVRNNSERWTFRDVHVHGNVHISSASSISILGGEIERAGDVLSSDPQIKKASGGVQPSNILIDGVNWHDFAVREAGAHIECLQIMAGNGITIRNSRFFGCSTQGVFINQALEGVISNLLVENNWFGPTVEGYNSLIVGGVSGSAVVRQNSFAGQAPRGSPSPVTWIGNTGVLGELPGRRDVLLQRAGRASRAVRPTGVRGRLGERVGAEPASKPGRRDRLRKTTTVGARHRRPVEADGLEPATRAPTRRCSTLQRTVAGTVRLPRSLDSRSTGAERLESVVPGMPCARR